MKNKKLTILLPTLFLALSAASCTIKRPSQPSESQPESTQPGTSSEEEVAVTSVALNKNTLALEVGEEETLQHTVLPANASNTQVTWESDHPEFASVSNRGKVTAVAEGTAKITVKSVADATKFAECTVTVSPATGGRYGTEDHPKSIAEALAVAEEECTNDKDYTLQPVVAKGKLIANPSSYTEGVAYQFNLQDLTDSSKKILVYSAEATSAIYQNDEVTVKGYIQLYGTTIEFSNKGTDKVAVVNKVVGTSAITKVANGATITFDGDELTSAKNGTEFTFAVAAPAGKEVHKVLINNAQATPDNETHKYKGKVEGGTLIEVVVKNEGEDLKDASLYYNGTETGNMTADNNAAAVNLDATFFDVRSTNSTGPYAGLNKSGQIRLYNKYKDATAEHPIGDGTTITVKVPSNSVIGSIKVVYDPATPGKDLEVKAGDTKVTGEGDWYQINGTQFSLQNVCTETTSKQIYIKSVDIYYVKGEDIPATGVEIVEGAAADVRQGENLQLHANLLPQGAVGDEIVWSITGNDKVTLDTETKGLVKVAADAVVDSTAIVTARSGTSETLFATITITVKEALNYGTEDAPIGVDELKAIMDVSPSKKIAQEAYVKGYVSSNYKPADDNGVTKSGEVWLTNNDGSVEKAFEIYWANYDSELNVSAYSAADNLLVGKQVTVKIAAQGTTVYNTTYETSANKGLIIAIDADHPRTATDAVVLAGGEEIPAAGLELKTGNEIALSYSLRPFASKTEATAAWSVVAGGESIISVNATTGALSATAVGNAQVKLTLGTIVKTIDVKVSAAAEDTSVLKASYDLSNYKAAAYTQNDGYTAGLTEEHALAIFNGTETSVVTTGTNCVTAVTGNKYYQAVADQGPGKGLKLGTGSAEGYVTLTTNVAIKKVVITVQAWSSSKLATYKINDIAGSATTLAAADATTPREISYMYDTATTSVKISSSIYSCVLSIALYVEPAE